MQNFRHLTFPEFTYRYQSNDFLLAQDLMGAGLISSPRPPQCSKKHPPVFCLRFTSHPWEWGCPRCDAATSLITEGCFLKKTQNYSTVLKALLLWTEGCSPKFIAEKVHYYLKKLGEFRLIHYY